MGFGLKIKLPQNRPWRNVSLKADHELRSTNYGNVKYVIRMQMSTYTYSASSRAKHKGYIVFMHSLKKYHRYPPI